MSIGVTQKGSAASAKVSPLSAAEIAPFFPGIEIEALIGSGGMGAVYRGKQKSLERLVAIKILFREDSENPEFVERFQREAQAQAKLNHPNIVGVYEFGEREDFVYILMELVKGTDLSRMIETSDVTPELSLKLVVHICRALQYAHDQGIVHRDIKPANILVGTDGVVKIADFGLAKVLGARDKGELTTKEERLGTPLYMAPEQRTSTADADHRADIYSLGVVFYEMLTGELPRGTFPQPSERAEIDDRVDDVVRKSMEIDPKRRYQQAREMQERVEAIRNEPSRGRRKGKRWWWLALGAGVCLAFALILSHWKSNSTQERLQNGLHLSTRQGHTFIQKQALKKGEYFGRAFALSDDLMLAGAPCGMAIKGQTTYGSGSVEVFELNESSLSATATLRCPEPKKGDLFGTALAIGKNEVIVSAPGYNQARGAVFVFRNERGMWKSVAKLEREESRKGDYFGLKLEANDRFLVVATQSGRVHIYLRDDQEWALGKTLVRDGVRFGYSVALDQDLLVVGANESRRNRGMAFVYRIEDRGETQLLATLHPPERVAGRIDFGHRVAILGSRILVSSHRASVGGKRNHGFVASYVLEGENWREEGMLPPPEGGSEFFFGIEMESVGDDVFVSAVGNNLMKGVVAQYGFDEKSSSLRLRGMHRRPEHPNADPQKFGVGLAATADWLVVGSQDFPQAKVRAGAVSVFQR